MCIALCEDARSNSSGHGRSGHAYDDDKNVDLPKI